jgi:hypothetical protein
MNIEFTNSSIIETVGDYDDSDIIRSKLYFYMDETEKILINNYDMVEKLLKDRNYGIK